MRDCVREKCYTRKLSDITQPTFVGQLLCFLFLHDVALVVSSFLLMTPQPGNATTVSVFLVWWLRSDISYTVLDLFSLTITRQNLHRYEYSTVQAVKTAVATVQ